MSYEPTVWKDGDLVTSAKLNKLEQGVATSDGGGVFITEATYTGNRIVLDKTAGEIYNAFQTGLVVIKGENDGVEINMHIVSINKNGTKYQILAQSDFPWMFYATGADSYPSDSEE